ncbi:MAG: hypothetical protein RR345_02120, partial [Erysipelotrichaceae bacterium]
MFKKMTKVVFIIAMLIQLVPTNIFANEEQKNFISNYIELKTEGEATGVYAQDALDIPEASYKLNVTVNVDGETKEASTLAYDLSTNPEQVSVMALDGYTVASTKLDNIDYHQEIIAFDHENNITSKELVINVTSNPKSELPVELLQTSNYSEFNYNERERASTVLVTFYAGEHGRIKQLGDLFFGNVEYYHVKKGTKLSEIETPIIK